MSSQSGKIGKIKELIFLGAGASAADGAPVQNQLFARYFAQPAHHTDADLIRFFKDFYGIENKKRTHTQYPTFEEILGILEFSLVRGESFKGYPQIPSDPKVQKIREQIVFLIAKILKHDIDSRRTNHNALVNRLIQENRILETAFLSLNYDILIDNALTEIHDRYDLDYCAEFANFERENDWHRPRPERAIKLFKLHGSLNWLYCPSCISLTITPKVKSVSTIADRPIKCQDCDSQMTPIIIPPTFFKVMSNYFLQEIWRKAETALLNIDRIIFCGYSFPDADVHVKYMLKRIEINSGKTPEVHIFNHYDGKKEENKKEEKIRYKRFFANRSKVFYREEGSFRDFCKRGI
jgi:hypothetical protein